MTEHDWLNSTDPQAMLSFLRDRGMLSDRKARLFACAAVRRVWHLLTDQSSRSAVEVAEGYADGLLGHAEIESVHDEAGRFAEAAHGTAAMAATAVAVDSICQETMRYVLEAVAEAVGVEARDDAWEETYQSPGRSDEERWAADEAIYREAAAKERASHADLLRDIIGNPIRPLSSLAPSLLTWQDGLVRRLAEEAYDKRQLPAGTLDPDRLAVLADALEEAGADAELVEHLRGPGAHYRGCHALDFLLDKP
jgi:hypothetical protein